MSQSSHRPGQEESDTEAEAEAESPARRRPRTQNRSCDPCRAGKKACDLRPSVTIHNHRPSRPCSTCSVRGLECTVAWLASRQSSQQIKKRARASRPLPDSDTTIDRDTRRQHETGAVHGPAEHSLISVSAPDGDLAGQLTARETCLQQFKLYIEVVDMPVTECLSTGCMPPTFPLGLAALTPLSNSAHVSMYLKQAHSWIQDCWETKSSTSWSSSKCAPHVFLAASVLDSLFRNSDPQAQRPYTATSRDASINETYKWVAMAAATQFVLGKDDETKKRARDLATATWHQAKQKLFGNLAATGSFRLALSLMLFGVILPPTSPTGDGEFEEDAAFALCEGLRRLQVLCVQARACFHRTSPPATKERPHPVQMLPSAAQENILELISAAQWFVVMVNSVAIATSEGRICAMPPEVRDNKAGCLLLTRGTVSRPNQTSSAVVGCYEQGLRESILARANAESRPVTALWGGGAIAEDVIIGAVSKSGSLVVLLFHVLALLTMETQNMRHRHECHDDETRYIDTHRRLITLIALVDRWRSSFGRYEQTITPSSIQTSGYGVRQFAFFCSNDGDLAVLLFYKTVERLEACLRDQRAPQSPAKERLWATIQSTKLTRKDQRLTSALQISFLASTARGLSTSGFEGKSGLKNYIQDIAAHPQPYMLVQAHSLAAKAFADEIHDCVAKMDTARATLMTAHLAVCLQGFQGLEEGLVRIPDKRRFQYSGTNGTG